MSADDRARLFDHLWGPEGLRIDDLALIAGAWAHYGRDGEHLLPPPLPLVNSMRRLAGRLVSAAEQAAEVSLARGDSNELGWSAPHLAPPWVARWLLTEWRLPWLAQLSAPVADECLQSLGDPRFHWFAHVFRAEGAQLGENQLQLAHRVWRGLQASARPEIFASVAIGLLQRLDELERVAAMNAIHLAPPAWRPFLLDAWAGAAPPGADLSTLALTNLLGLARAPEHTAEIRLNAALLLLRRAAAARGTSEGVAFLSQLAELGQSPPFRDHTGLMRELRRLSAHLK